MWLDYVPIALAVGIPSVATALGVVRYFWKKEKCFITMQNTINSLSAHDNSSLEVHNGHDQEIQEIQKRQAKNEIYLKLVLNHLKIPYDE